MEAIFKKKKTKMSVWKKQNKSQGKMTEILEKSAKSQGILLGETCGNPEEVFPNFLCTEERTKMKSNITL